MITAIRLQNFRSYGDESFEFDPGVNIVVGPNASGKTNLLEAILVLAGNSSYRARDAELIKFGKSWARLEGNFQNHGRVLKIEPPARSFIIDGHNFRRLSLERTIPTVIFEPNHLQLLIRGPEQRRDFFDDLLERSRPGFKSLRVNYRRTLSQRNALLKRGRRPAEQQLFVWNIRLSELGSQIALARQGLTDDINRQLARTYSQISGRRSKVEVKYASQFPAGSYASHLLHKLEVSVSLDFERGFTAHGPHREDFNLLLNSQPAGTTASRGETRSLLLALKIFELKLIEKTRGQKPIFLLDDVFSELDGKRRQALVSNLRNYQTIITTTDAESVLEYFSSGHNLIPIAKN
ncbi:MAG TPA: DNA replication and repair protein RecF [Candidatus Saccharimonadales bacterium]|nr:DNA replication and repair protein RecF [Candidatus Saccharimonadales bacterium]